MRIVYAECDIVEVTSEAVSNNTVLVNILREVTTSMKTNGVTSSPYSPSDFTSEGPQDSRSEVPNGSANEMRIAIALTKTQRRIGCREAGVVSKEICLRPVRHS